jgi:hypothetical protein
MQNTRTCRCTGTERPGFPEEIRKDSEFVTLPCRFDAAGFLFKKDMQLVRVRRQLTDKDVWGDYQGSWLRIKDVYLNGPSFGGAIGSAKAFSRILRSSIRETLCAR